MAHDTHLLRGEMPWTASNHSTYFDEPDSPYSDEFPELGSNSSVALDLTVEDVVLVMGRPAIFRSEDMECVGSTAEIPVGLIGDTPEPSGRTPFEESLDLYQGWAPITEIFSMDRFRFV